MDIVSGPAMAIAASMVAAPPPSPALSLMVERHGDAIEVRLIGHSTVAQHIRYDLRFSGKSNSRNRGSTDLAAGRTVTLSTMRMSVADHWCIHVAVEEGSGPRYELTQGDCA